MTKLIFVENYVFDSDYFHSCGVKRLDTRTKEQRAEALASGKQVKPAEWPVVLQVYIILPEAGGVRTMNFQSRSGDEATIDLFIATLKQLLPAGVTSSWGVSFDKQEMPEAFKDFLMEDFGIKPAEAGRGDAPKENKNES